MKKIITIAVMVLLTSSTMGQFVVQFDTVIFGDANGKRGQIGEFVLYSDDSIKINGLMYRFQSTAIGNNWQTEGSYYIKPDPDTKIIKYPGIPYWNHMMTLNTDGPVWFKKSDGTLRGKIMIPETVGGTETATITCEDGGTYLYETEGADFVIYIDDIDSIPAPFMIKNLGKNSTVTVQSIDGLPFDSTGKTFITLDYGDWCRFTPDSTRFITEMSMNKTTLEQYYEKSVADTVFVKVEDGGLFRYNIYESGEETIDVLATASTVTATVTGGTAITLNIPTGVELISARIRTDKRSSISLDVNYHGVAQTMKNRWMPNVSVWREDTGGQYKATSTNMDLGDFSTYTITGLISTTTCQIRLDF